MRLQWFGAGVCAHVLSSAILRRLFLFGLQLHRAAVDWMSQFKILYAYKMGGRPSTKPPTWRTCWAGRCSVRHSIQLSLRIVCGHIKNVMNTTTTYPQNTKLHNTPRPRPFVFTVHLLTLLYTLPSTFTYSRHHATYHYMVAISGRVYLNSSGSHPTMHCQNYSALIWSFRWPNMCACVCRNLFAPSPDGGCATTTAK